MRRFIVAMIVGLAAACSPGCNVGTEHKLAGPRVPDDDEQQPVPKNKKSEVAVRSAAPEAAAKSGPASSQGLVKNDSEFDRRVATIKKMAVLATALEEYKRRSGRYPDQEVEGGLSWRVALLPILGLSDLYQKFRLGERWDSAHNRALFAEMPDIYRSLTRRDEKTSFLLVTGPGTAYTTKRGLSDEQFTDGLANTILLAEVADPLAKPWTQPEDYVFRREHAQQDLFGLRKDCCFVILGAIGVRRVPANVGDKELLALLSPSGGEPVASRNCVAIAQAVVDTDLIAELESNPPRRFSPVAAVPGVNTTKAGGRKADASEVSNSKTQQPTAEPTPPPADPRLAVPEEKALAAAATMAKEVYKAEYTSSKKREEKRAFARKLLGKANQVNVTADVAGMFVLLREARDIGAQGGDIDTALAAVDKLGKTFRVDPLPMKLKALEQAAAALENPAEDEKLFTKSMELEVELLAVDDFDGAKRALTLAATGARRCGKRELAAQVAPCKDELEEVKRAFDRVAGALRKLVLSPDDPAASGAVGKYLCLVKQNWARGLTLLARGDDQRFRELAAADLSNPNLAEAQAALADRWWELSEQQGAGKSGAEKSTPEKSSPSLDKLSPVERRSARIRAAHWYKQALPALPASLTSERAKQRIAEATEKKDEQHPKQTGASAKTRSKSAR